jgi:hypothetical protein
LKVRSKNGAQGDSQLQSPSLCLTARDNAGNAMNDEMKPAALAAEASVSDGIIPDDDGSFADHAVRRALAVAWMAVLAGLAVQILVLVGRLGAGGSFVGAQFLATMAQGISWSVLVCGAVAVGTVAGKARAAITGLIGLIAGPAAWGAAKGVQKGVQSMLGVAQDPINNFFLTVSAIKGVEYAVLGAALGYMVGKKWANLPAHLALGLAVGSLFGALFVTMTINFTIASGKPLALPAIVGQSINELVFPVGCALVIYAVQRLRRRVGL